MRIPSWKVKALAICAMGGYLLASPVGTAHAALTTCQGSIPQECPLDLVSWCEANGFGACMETPFCSGQINGTSVVYCGPEIQRP
jgi:hypothetical protein